MNPEKRKRLEEAGWRVGSAEDFLSSGDALNLYLLTRPEHLNADYDDYIGAVVAAETEEEARKMSLGENGRWIMSDLVIVKFLGIAQQGIASGVILSSLNSG